jgi:hypothetical protein
VGKPGSGPAARIREVHRVPDLIMFSERQISPCLDAQSPSERWDGDCAWRQCSFRRFG